MSRENGRDPGAGSSKRCFGDGDPLYERYHDEEWGFPVLDERGLYERLTLEAFQSGLSWRTILAKRDSFRRAFAGFDPDAVARFGDADVERLLGDASIVRNRAKVEAAIANARATVALRESDEPLEALIRAHAPKRREPAHSALIWSDLINRLAKPPPARLFLCLGDSQGGLPMIGGRNLRRAGIPAGRSGGWESEVVGRVSRDGIWRKTPISREPLSPIVGFSFNLDSVG